MSDAIRLAFRNPRKPARPVSPISRHASTLYTSSLAPCPLSPGLMCASPLAAQLDALKQTHPHIIEAIQEFVSEALEGGDGSEAPTVPVFAGIRPPQTPCGHQPSDVCFVIDPHTSAYLGYEEYQRGAAVLAPQQFMAQRVIDVAPTIAPYLDAALYHARKTSAIADYHMTYAGRTYYSEVSIEGNLAYVSATQTGTALDRVDDVYTAAALIGVAHHVGPHTDPDTVIAWARTLGKKMAEQQD